MSFYWHRHFYVSECRFSTEWLVCEDGSTWAVRFATKYRAQFVRDYMFKWLCNHDYYRLHAFVRFLEKMHYVTSDWKLIREQVLVIDVSPRMAF